MSVALPPGIAPEDEIALTWKNTEKGVKVVATLGGATIVVKTSHEDADKVPWLAAALPNILEAAWDAIEKDSQEET